MSSHIPKSLQELMDHKEELIRDAYMNGKERVDVLKEGDVLQAIQDISNPELRAAYLRLERQLQRLPKD